MTIRVIPPPPSVAHSSRARFNGLCWQVAHSERRESYAGYWERRWDRRDAAPERRRCRRGRA